MVTRMLNGRCECRAVRYRVPDEFLYAANCHCSNCRAGTGSAFKAFAGIEREKLGSWRAERRCSFGATTRATTRAVGSAARFSTRWCAMVPTSTSPWAPLWTNLRFGRPSTSSLARKLRGSRSRTNSLNPRSISRASLRLSEAGLLWDHAGVTRRMGDDARAELCTELCTGPSAPQRI